MPACPKPRRPRQITVADGLPSNRINGIAEDRNGYLWIATSDGLARYDGIDFRIWRVEQGLRDNFVWAVHVDARNRVWIGTQQAGLAMLDADRRGSATTTAPTRRIGSDDVWSVTSTPDGAIWFGTADGGLHRIGRRRQGHALHAARRRPAQPAACRVSDSWWSRTDGTLVDRHQGRRGALDRARLRAPAGGSR